MPTRATTDTSTNQGMDSAYQDEFTENLMASPEQREDVAHDLHLDPVSPSASSAPAGDEDEEESEDDEDDEEEEEPAS